MTIEEAKAVIAKTDSPYLKRDMEKFIEREERRRKRGKTDHKYRPKAF